MKRAYQDVLDFHEAMGITVGETLGVRETALREGLLDEELDELLAAIDEEDIVEVADALADCIYILIGTAITFGIPLPAVWNEVHRSNMEKVGGPVRADGKQLKPNDWTPPNIAKVLADAAKERKGK